jgi:metal-responsive CopG/Arc/MetJ family transcriptional regulator
VLALKGLHKDVQKLADGILSLKGVKHGQLVITGPGDQSA